jgi:hypothetical protein
LEDVIVIGLAAARVARAISCDEITVALRRRLDHASASSEDGHRRALARWSSNLVHCPVCTGWWASLALSALWPGPMRFRRGLSVAGAQVIITLAERLVSEEGRAAVREADDLERHRLNPAGAG